MLHFDDGLEFLDKWRCLFFDASWPWLKNETKVFFSDKLKKGHFSSDFFFQLPVMSCWLWFFAYFTHLWHCKIFFKDTTKSRLLEED